LAPPVFVPEVAATRSNKNPFRSAALRNQRLKIVSSPIPQTDISEESTLNADNIPVEETISTTSVNNPSLFVTQDGTSINRVYPSDKDQMEIQVQLMTLDTAQHFYRPALIDSGCMTTTIDVEFVRKNKLNTKKLPKPIQVLNADGSANNNGPLTDFIELQLRIDDHVERITCVVANLRSHILFLGYDWLQQHNPDINWTLRSLDFTRCPEACGSPFHSEIEEGDRVFAINTVSYCEERELWIRATSNISTNLAAAHEQTKTKKSWQESVPSFYHDYDFVFTKDSFDSLPDRRPWDHAIELIPDAEPVNCKIYPLAPTEQQELDDFLEEHLQSGRIRPSKSPMASPFFFVKKKDGRLRPVQDYRKLNALTIKNRYPLPLTTELIDHLKGAKYFTKLDVRWGYNNVRIKDGDEWKAAFRTNRGLFEPLVMFFGLTNSPATFQTMMNALLRELINDGHVLVYMDDILIFTPDLDSHRKVVRQVLQIMKDNQLFLKPEKCDWEQLEIEYLGLIVSEGHVRMDPVKIAAVKDWLTPSCKLDIQIFLGFANFYRRFIKDFGKLALPLSTLTGKVDWLWGPDQQSAFDALRATILADPLLVIADDDGQFRIETDASGFAKGAVLSQFQRGEFRTVAFMSKAMLPAERNYDVHDRELLAIMTALAEWRRYLMGAKEIFEIWTDHKNLEYFRLPQHVNYRQARWFGLLAAFHFTIHYKPGHTNVRADALSRLPWYDKTGAQNDNVTILPDSLFVSEVVTFSSITDDLLLSSSPLDAFSSLALSSSRDGWSQSVDGLALWRGRIYVPNLRSLRERIIADNHSSVVAGHPGRYRTHDLISRTYWWPGVAKDVQRYITGCETCQRTKTRTHAPSSLLHPLSIPSENWECISTDLIGPLPLSQGYNAISVTVDRLSKMIRVVPTNTEVTSEGIARIFRDNIFRHHGLPKNVISDRGVQFVSKFLTSLYNLLGISASPSTAYHPQTDGQTERMNPEIEHYLRVFCNYRQDDWADWLSLAEFAYNDKQNKSTHHSPFYLNYGRHPWKGTEPRPSVPNQSASEFVEKMDAIRDEAQASLKHAQLDMKRFYDAHRLPSPDYQIGDRVWLEASHITALRPSKKLSDKRFGPFTVLHKHGAAYHLDIPSTWRSIHPVFNEVLLSPFHPPAFPSQLPPPPPPPDIDSAGTILYEVSSILASRRRGRGTQYLVHWKGYPHEDDTWEPSRQINDDAPGAVEDFYYSHPSAIRTLLGPTSAEVDGTASALTASLIPESCARSLFLIDRILFPSSAADITP
jgi:hypothetical protein